MARTPRTKLQAPPVTSLFLIGALVTACVPAHPGDDDRPDADDDDAPLGAGSLAAGLGVGIELEVSPRSGALRAQIPLYRLVARGGTEIAFDYVYSSDVWQYDAPFATPGLAGAEGTATPEALGPRGSFTGAWTLVDSIPRIADLQTASYTVARGSAGETVTYLRHRLFFRVGADLVELFSGDDGYVEAGPGSNERFWQPRRVWRSLNGELTYDRVEGTLRRRDGSVVVYDADTAAYCHVQCLPGTSGTLRDRHGNETHFGEGVVEDPDGRRVVVDDDGLTLPDGGRIELERETMHVNARMVAPPEQGRTIEVCSVPPVGIDVGPNLVSTEGPKMETEVQANGQTVAVVYWHEETVIQYPVAPPEGSQCHQEELGEGRFFDGDQSVTTAVRLPDGRAYELQYDEAPVEEGRIRVDERSETERHDVSVVTDLALTRIRMPGGGSYEIEYGLAEPNRAPDTSVGTFLARPTDNRPVLAITRDPVLGPASTTRYETGSDTSTVVHPDGSRITTQRYLYAPPLSGETAWKNGLVRARTAQDADGTVLWSTRHDYRGAGTRPPPQSGHSGTPREIDATMETTTFGSGATSRTVTRTWQHDAEHRVVREELRDGDEDGELVGATTTQWVDDPAYVEAGLRALPWRTEQYAGGTLVSATDFAYDGAPLVRAEGAEGLRDVGPLRGNATLVTSSYARMVGAPRTTSRTFYETGDPASMTDATGSTWTLHRAFGPCGDDAREREVTLDGGLRVTAVYDCMSGALLRETDERGAITSYEYDRRGALAAVRLPGDETPTLLVEPHLFGVDGTDASDDVTAQRLVVRRKDGSDDGHVTQQFLDGFGAIVQERSEASEGGDASHPGAPRDLVAGVELAWDGAMTARFAPRYEEPSDRYTAPDGPADAFVYDGMGRVRESRPAGLAATRVAYDGFVRTATRLDRARRDTVDAEGKPVRSEERWSECAAAGPDACPRPDAARGIPGCDDEGWCATEMRYDEIGQLSEVIDPLGHHTLLVHDGEGRLLSMTDPDLGSWSYAYDEVGRLLAVTDPDDRTTRRHYDALGRIRLEDHPGDDADVVHYYDGAGPSGDHEADVEAARTKAAPMATAGDQIGFRTAISSGAFVARFLHDARGRIVEQRDEREGATYVTRNVFGTTQGPSDGLGDTLVERVASNGERIAWTFDRGGREWSSTATPPGGQAEPVELFTQWDARGGVRARGFADGTVVAQTFDARHGRLASIDVARSGAALRSIRYGFDDHGDVASVSDSLFGDRVYSHDTRGRLRGVDDADGHHAYGWDAIGNLVVHADAEQQHGAGGRAHAVRRANGLSYAYDPSGNLTSRSDGLSLAWSTQRMPTRVEREGVTTDRSYRGDVLMARTDGGVRTQLLPGAQRVGEGFRVGIGDAERDLDGTLRFRVTDHLGNVIVETSRGETAQVAYQPFGAVWKSTGPAPRLGFAGRETTAGGLLDFGARLYDPTSGAFVSPDATDADGPNRYAFARGNPTSLTDLDGRNSCYLLRGVLIGCHVGDGDRVKTPWGDYRTITAGGRGVLAPDGAGKAGRPTYDLDELEAVTTSTHHATLAERFGQEINKKQPFIALRYANNVTPAYVGVEGSLPIVGGATMQLNPCDGTLFISYSGGTKAHHSFELGVGAHVGFMTKITPDLTNEEVNEAVGGSSQSLGANLGPYTVNYTGSAVELGLGAAPGKMGRLIGKLNERVAGAITGGAHTSIPNTPYNVGYSKEVKRYRLWSPQRGPCR